MILLSKINKGKENLFLEKLWFKGWAKILTWGYFEKLVGGEKPQIWEKREISEGSGG